jgi:signal peptidase I
VSDESDLRSRIEAQVAARRGRATDSTQPTQPAQPAQPAGPAQPAAAATEHRHRSETPRSSAGVGRHSSTPRSGSRAAARSTAPRPQASGRIRALRLGLVVVLAIGVALVLRTFVVASYYIPSASMEPTLHGCPGCNNDHVLVDKLSYKLHSVHRGDVVVFDRPPAAATTDKVLIKRVIGLPGDTLTDQNGTLLVNGVQLKEPYVNPSCDGTQDFPASVTVPRGDVYVMGDNRCDSLDSRSFGPVAQSSIVGRAFVIVWPLGRLHWL